MSNSKWQIGPVKLISGETAWIDAINPGQENYHYTGRFNLYGVLTPIGWGSDGVESYGYADSLSSLAPPEDKIDIADSKIEEEGEGL